MFSFRRGKSDLRQAIEAYLESVSHDPLIKRVLASDDVEQHLAKFDRADAIALRKQRSYRRARLLALWAGLIGASVAGVGLLPLESWLPPWSHDVKNVVRMLSLTLTSLAILWLSMGQSATRWLEERGAAEGARADAFRAIVLSGAREKQVLPQALACFKSAHLERQLRFFKDRGKDHEEAIRRVDRFRVVGRLLSAGSALLGFAAIVNLVDALGFVVPYLTPAFQWLLVPESDRWQTGLSAMAASILVFASARPAVDRDVRNASYYALAATDLDRIKEADLQNAETAATAGNTTEVLAFSEKVQTVLSAEHLAWKRARDDSP